MTAKTIDIQEAQTSLLQLLTSAIKGVDIIIAKDNVPLVRLVPVQSSQRRVAGLHEGAMYMHDDFDAPLPDEFWLGSK